LPQGGLEIPCLLKFIAKTENEAAKAKDLLESALGSVKGRVVSCEARAQAGFNGREADGYDAEMSSRDSND